MDVRPAGSVAVDFPVGDGFVVGAVCALAIAIVAAIITAKAAVTVVPDISLLLGVGVSAFNECTSSPVPRRSGRRCGSTQGYWARKSDITPSYRGIYRPCPRLLTR